MGVWPEILANLLKLKSFLWSVFSYAFLYFLSFALFSATILLQWKVSIDIRLEVHFIFENIALIAKYYDPIMLDSCYKSAAVNNFFIDFQTYCKI